ncbi:MAG: hypothetical protein WC527_01815 [Candidatus Margulisiibacteriota bacterium]
MKKCAITAFIIYFAGISYAAGLDKTDKPAKKSVSFGGQPTRAVPLGRSLQKPAPFNFSTSPKKEQYPVQVSKTGLEVGIKAGASAGLTGAVGDLSYSLDSVVKGASLRGSFGYLTGAETAQTQSLKLATVNLDAIYSLGKFKAFDSPLDVYIGGGLIYPFKVNRERSSGAWGAHAYFGSKYLVQDNVSLYGELAYTGIKYNPEETALKGVEAMLGYSYSF